MTCSKLSTIEKIPISVRMKIPKERLLAENQKEEWQIISEDCSIQGLPGVSYYVGLCSKTFENHERFNGRCLFILMGLKNALKMNISLKVTSVGSNEFCEYYIGAEFQDAYDYFYIRCGGTFFDELFDPATKWFVNDFLVFVVEAILTVHKEDSELAGLNCEISKTFEYEFGMNLWDRDDKNLAFIIDGKEIKVHRIVVESKSSEWKEMIQSGLKESEDGKIAIDDFDFEIVETALKFCYGIEEKHLWSVDSAIEVLQFADNYDLNDLKNSVETFLSSQLSPMNVCKITNLSILTNSVKLREACFEYLLECNQKKIFVSDLDSMNKDFVFELMKSSFSQSPNLNEFEMIPQIVEQVQNQPPQIRRSFADDYGLNDLKNSGETFLSSQFSPINACKITNLSILTNSVKLRETCFEYLLECNQKKISVADLDSLNKDFAFELLKSSFSQSPNLNKMIPQTVEQIQNRPPQIRKSFVTKVTVIAAFMLISSFLIGAFLTNDDSFLQGINQIWHKHIFCGIQLLWFGVYFAIDHFQALRQQKYFKWINLLIFVAISGFLVTSCINCHGQKIAFFASGSTLSSTIGFIVTALFDIVTSLFGSYDFTDDYIWRYCLIPNVFILFIKDFLPFPWLFAIISCFVCLELTQSTLIQLFQQIMGNKRVVINENEFVHASLTLFTIILQVFIFTLGYVNGVFESNTHRIEQTIFCSNLAKCVCRIAGNLKYFS